VSRLRWAPPILVLAVIAGGLLFLRSSASEEPAAPINAPAPVGDAPRAETLRTRDVTLLAAGDIAQCESKGDEATARLAARYPRAPIAALGDMVYPSGTADDFARCYEPSWGRVDARVHPAAGNHEYGTGVATAYFARYGARAGTPGRGWYSWDLKGWHIVVLNSNCSLVPNGGCARGSEQERWLRADLAAHPARCTLAYWHHPRFSSGLHGDDSSVEPLRQALIDANVEILLTGHDHHYERFAPDHGLTQWVVGTGGAGNYPTVIVKRGSRVRWSGGHGLLALSLRRSGYRWSFLPVRGDRFADSGAGRCH
jgi:3',5'-cyclic AMP phosphodiesterase CpdA